MKRGPAAQPSPVQTIATTAIPEVIVSRSVPPTVPVVRRHAYTPTEAAQVLGICRASVYNLMSRGELRSVKLGGSRRIPVEEIDRLLRGGVA